jgi:hypothetical protein
MIVGMKTQIVVVIFQQGRSLEEGVTVRLCSAKNRLEGWKALFFDHTFGIF